MGPVLVVVPFVGREDPAEVGEVPYQGPIEEPSTATADPPPHDRVHAERPNAASQDPHPGSGEDRVEALVEDPSRSCRTNLIFAPPSSRSITRFRACWTIQSPPGWMAAPRIR